MQWPMIFLGGRAGAEGRMVDRSKWDGESLTMNWLGGGDLR